MNYEEMQTETVETTAETEVTTEEMLSAFDEGWDDDGYSSYEEYTESEAEEVVNDEAEADQQEAEAVDASETTEETEQTEEQKTEVADQRFRLKHLDEEREVDRDEVIALAQKGMDYDRKTTKLNNKIAEYEEFLKELAAPGNLSIEELIETTRAKMFMTSERKAGREVSETDAMLKIRRDRAEKQQSMEQQQQAENEAAKQTSAEAIQRFVSVYPNVKAEDIPQSVWDEAGKTGDLLGAYSRHENTQLKKRIEALETNRKNENRSTGSRKTAGSAKAKDPFDEGWDSI